MNTDSPIIEIQNLSRHYAKLDAVNGLTLNVRAGKCYGFFGRNGAGKTTTIKCLLNLLRPDSGAETLSTRPETEGQSSLQRPAHAARAHRRDLSRTGTARARRADGRP